LKLFFEVTSGDREGSRFEIRDGASIGRKGTDIIIRDPKISSRHAVVEERDHGYYLVDLGSSNGLKIEGNRVSEAHLLPGVAIQLGRTFITVIDLDEVGETPEKPVVRTWQETAAGVIARVAYALANNSLPMQKTKMFAKPVVLSAVGGPQTGQTWTLVYGPREIGADSLDVRLLEEGIPNTAFELSQTSDGLMLKTEHADKISLNGAGSRKSQTLNDGDEIVIQNTRLRVKLRDL
jgi:pSer/pThr/pTyr-binding forkhead associated (FHA) protein